jgi:hypothetical protein
MRPAYSASLNPGEGESGKEGMKGRERREGGEGESEGWKATHKTPIQAQKSGNHKERQK